MQDRQITDQIAGVENDGPTSREWKMQDLENDWPNWSSTQKSYNK